MGVKARIAKLELSSRLKASIDFVVVKIEYGNYIYENAVYTKDTIYEILPHFNTMNNLIIIKRK